MATVEVVLDVRVVTIDDDTSEIYRGRLGLRSAMDKL